MKKQRDEAREKHKTMQQEKFEVDFNGEEKISVRRRVSAANEVLLRNPAVGGGSSDESEVEVGPGEGKQLLIITVLHLL